MVFSSGRPYGLIAEDGAAGGEGARLEQLKPLWRQLITKQKPSAAMNDRYYPNAILIEEPLVHQSLREDGAPEDEDVAVAPLLQCRHFPCHLVLHDRRIVPIRGLERARTDHLRKAVHVVGDGSRGSLPIGGHPLVCHAAEQKHVGRLQLIERESLELVTPDLFAPGQVPVLLALEVPIERDEIPHNQFSHFPTPVIWSLRSTA